MSWPEVIIEQKKYINTTKIQILCLLIAFKLQPLFNLAASLEYTFFGANFVLYPLNN